MKKTLQSTGICTAGFLLMTMLLGMRSFSQSPESFNYQAVLRDASGNIKANTAVSLQIDILKGAADGSNVFSETHSATTNNSGLVILKIGSINASDFSDIAWSDGPYYIKVTADGNEMGTSQLLSVPYALYAASGVGEQGPQGEQGPVGPAGAKGDQGDPGTATTNATDLTSGTLNTARYSAYDDLEAEGYLDLSTGTDLLTRDQLDLRYNAQIGFFAYNSTDQAFTSDNFHKVAFDLTKFNDGSDFNTTSNRFIVPANGAYAFSASVGFASLDDNTTIYLYCYVNGSAYCNLASSKVNGTTQTISGSVILKLHEGDTVEIYVYSSDVNFSIMGEPYPQTHFSGHIIYRLL